MLRQTGLDDVAGRQASKLSGGQTQRVRFAMALVSDPALMVLDEPTAALDVEARHTFWDAMRDFAAQGRTVLFATHYLEEADRFADRIVLMAGGRIVADGSATQIKSVVDVRTIRATLPDVDLDEPSAACRAYETPTDTARPIVLTCSDSDATLRALLAQHPTVRDSRFTAVGSTRPSDS